MYNKVVYLELYVMIMYLWSLSNGLFVVIRIQSIKHRFIKFY